MRSTVFFLTLLTLSACTPKLYVERGPDHLASINIIGRDGFSETINNSERLNQYENVDFCQNQPYEKVLQVYGRNEEGDVRAYITTYHPNGQLKQYLEILNNSAHGNYSEWHENGVQKVDATVIGGVADIGKTAENSWLFDGVSQAWDEEGNLVAQIQYEKGELHGNSTYFHKCGSIWKTLPYFHGALEGTVMVYKENGEVFQTSEHQKGKPHGLTQKFWSPQQISSSECYVKGFLEEAEYFDLNGSRVSHIEGGDGYRALFTKEGVCELQQYQEGTLDGLVKVFGSEGQLIRYYHMKNGQKHGEEVEYYFQKNPEAPLKPLISMNWYDGAIQGSVKTWYPNGALESHREITANQKNGISTGWYHDGSIMLIEEYENNKLVKGEYYQKGEKFPKSEIHDGRGIATLYDPEGNFLQKVNYFNGVPS